MTPACPAGVRIAHVVKSFPVSHGITRNITSDVHFSHCAEFFLVLSRGRDGVTNHLETRIRLSFFLLDDPFTTKPNHDILYIRFCYEDVEHSYLPTWLCRRPNLYK